VIDLRVPQNTGKFMNLSAIGDFSSRIRYMELLNYNVSCITFNKIIARVEAFVINDDEVLTWKICLPICMRPSISINVKICYGVLALNVIEQFRFATTLMHKKAYFT
jgi:hypothetical protein